MQKLKNAVFLLVIVLMLATTGIGIARLGVLISEQESSSALSATSSTPASKTPSFERNEWGMALLENGRGFEQLEEPLRVQYNEILTQVVANAHNDTTLEENVPGMTVRLYGYEHTDETAQRLLKAVFNDHPELFYISSNFLYKRIDDRMFVELRYTMAAQERFAAMTELEQTIEQLLAECKADTEYATERNLHDALLRRCSYNFEAAEQEETGELHWKMSSPYAALCSGEAICGGYARAMQWLLARADIQSTLVFNEDHVWNLVWIEGETYFLDPTWNDFDDDIVSHRLFNVTYDALIRSRSVPDVTPLLQSAVSRDANYFVREGAYIDGEWRGALTDSLRRQLQEGNGVLEFCFAPEVYEEAVAYIDSEAFFDEFAFSVESALAWRSISYYTDDEMYTVSLKPNEQ